MKWADGKIRCCWANPRNERYIRYHDEEWGVPVHDDRKLFEMLILECFQAGLSWECVLKKRDAFRKAFDNFDPEKVRNKLEASPGIIFENTGCRYQCMGIPEGVYQYLALDRWQSS